MMASAACLTVEHDQVQRCLDPVQLYAVASHPSVAPGLANYDLDKIAMVVLDDRNVVLMRGDTAAVFEFCAPGVFEVHALTLPGGRGRKAIDSGIAFFRHLVAYFGARLIWAEPPLANRPVRWLARQVGMTARGVERRPNGLREIFSWEPAR